MQSGGPWVEGPLLGVFKIRVLRKVFGQKIRRLPTGWRKYVMKYFVICVHQTLLGRLNQGE